MAGTNVESARQKSAGDEMVSAEFLPKQDHRELNSACNHPLALVDRVVERREPRPQST